MLDHAILSGFILYFFTYSVEIRRYIGLKLRSSYKYIIVYKNPVIFCPVHSF